MYRDSPWRSIIFSYAWINNILEMMNLSNEHNLKKETHQFKAVIDEIKRQLEAMLAVAESQAEPDKTFTVEKAVSMM